MQNFDWPLAIELAIVFVVMSYVRWRWFSARMKRPRPAPPPPKSPDDGSTP